MPATASLPFAQDDPDPGPAALTLHPQAEDAHWSRCYWSEPYHQPGLDYEDYAAAYCVGYVGWAQYGGCYEDAENSLCANWQRLKSGSRLELDQARCAMRAAWERVQRLSRQPAVEEPLPLRVVLGEVVREPEAEAVA